MNGTNNLPIQQKMKIAYILGTFPLLTTTFIDREIVEMQRQGVKPVIISIRRPTSLEMSNKIAKLGEKTKYILPVPWLKFLAANLYFGLTRFWIYSSTLVYLLTRPHNRVATRISTLLHFAEGVWVAALLLPEQVDHIHAHFADRATVVAMVASRLLNVRYSFFAHAADIYISPTLLPEKIAGAVFVATCTAYNKKNLECIANPNTNSKIELVYHGLDLDKFPTAIPKQDNKLRLLSVGQLREKKGFPYLIHACQHLRNWGYNFSCEIVGQGPQYMELEALIKELDLEDTVFLCGALPHSEVITKFANATIFTLACMQAENADRDGIPNVILEAMATQLPVVSTRFSGIPEVVYDGTTGILVPPKDDKALAKALATLLDDVSLRNKLGLAGRRYVERNFDIRTNVERLISIFERSLL